MAMSFMQMAEEAMSDVNGLSAEEAHRQLSEDSEALLIGVSDAADIPSTGGANISYMEAGMDAWSKAGLPTD